MEIHALSARGWSVSAIARHTGRDRKTIRRYLTGDGGRQRRMPAPSSLEPWRGYIAARFADDPHLPAVALLDELLAAGFRRSYQRLVRELRRTELRPVCLVCEQMSFGHLAGALHEVRVALHGTPRVWRVDRMAPASDGAPTVTHPSKKLPYPLPTSPSLPLE